MARDQRDYYYYKAHKEGYRSRASYKLKQINEKEHIIKKKDNIVDLGAAPGGWLQVCSELSSGIIIGVDIQDIKYLPNVITIKEDIREAILLEKILNYCNGNVNVVLCDAAPNLTGNWSLDHSRGIELNEFAFQVAKKILSKGGTFVVKVFQGDLFNNYYRTLKNSFVYVKLYSPKASRSTSAEVYIICKKYFKVPVQKNETYKVTIESIGKNGDGIAYIEKFIIFVKNSFVGQTINILITDIKINYAFGIIINENYLKIKDTEYNCKLKKENCFFIEPDEDNNEFERAF